MIRWENKSYFRKSREIKVPIISIQVECTRETNPDNTVFSIAYEQLMFLWDSAVAGNGHITNRTVKHWEQSLPNAAGQGMSGF